MNFKRGLSRGGRGGRARASGASASARLPEGFQVSHGPQACPGVSRGCRAGPEGGACSVAAPQDSCEAAQRPRGLPKESSGIFQISAASRTPRKCPKGRRNPTEGTHHAPPETLRRCPVHPATFLVFSRSTWRPFSQSYDFLYMYIFCNVRLFTNIQRRLLDHIATPSLQNCAPNFQTPSPQSGISFSIASRKF